ISVRYPLVELGTAVAFVAVAWRFGLTWPLVAYLYLAAVGIALALIDLDHQRLPDALVLPSYPVLIAALVLASANLGGTADWGALGRAGIGGAGLFVFYYVLWFLKGMGYGDVKLAGVLGFATAWLGWGPFAVGAFAAFVVGGLVSLVLVVARRAGRKTKVPFGPSMILGAGIGVACGEQVWSAYIGSMSL
ncbi:MAG: A24 family peptidase, partial [Micrococcales bacterium]|nr:A24 family peptidase [Micrococcales bacterium]